MEYTVINRKGQIFTRCGFVGHTTLVGLRIVSVTFESREEMNKLFTPEGVEWAKKNLIPAFRIN